MRTALSTTMFAITFAAVGLGNAEAQKKPTSPDAGLVGLEDWLAPSRAMSDPESVVRQLWAAQFERFVEMQEDWVRHSGDDTTLYRLAELHKAGALCLDRLHASGGMSFMNDRVSTYASAWGSSADADTQEEAIAKALNQCEIAKRKYGHEGCECRLVADDNGAVVEPPPGWVEAVPAIQKEIQSNRKKRLAGSRLTEVLPASLRALKSANRVLRNDSIRFLSDFRLRAPVPLTIGYPDELRDYASLCHDRYSYALSPLEPKKAAQARKDLSEIELGRPSACYAISIDTQSNPTHAVDGPTELQCRYLDRHDPTSWQTLRLPQAWSSSAELANLSEIWVESVVRVSEQGHPLEKRPVSKPVLLKTADGLYYLAVEVLAPEPDGGCNVSYPFHGKAFDVSACADRDACAAGAYAALHEAIAIRLSADPFAAAPSEGNLKPYEVRFERVDKPSLILGGAYYERATYTLQSWSADDERPLDAAYLRSGYLGLARHNPKYVFIELQHIYTVAKNKAGPFRDASQEEVIALADQVDKVLPASLANVCAKIDGRLDSNGVCVLSGDSQ